MIWQKIKRKLKEFWFIGKYYLLEKLLFPKYLLKLKNHKKYFEPCFYLYQDRFLLWEVNTIFLRFFIPSLKFFEWVNFAYHLHFLTSQSPFTPLSSDFYPNYCLFSLYHFPMAAVTITQIWWLKNNTFIIL